MTPRKYQQEAIDYCLEYLAARLRAYVQLPTGTGKSLVLMLIAKRWRAQGRPVYIVAPTDEAVAQLHALARRLGLFAVLDTRMQKAPKSAPLVITSYSCAWRRYKQRIKKDTLCLLDECHHINYQAPVNAAILKSFEAAIGLSATPWSKGCAGYFGRNLYTYKLSQAVADGAICPFEVACWQEPQRGRYQIIYTNSGEYRTDLCSRLPQTDFAIYKRASARQVIGRFRRSNLGTIVVNRMLTEGFDLPQIKKVWIARKTKSRIAVMQMAGRALRPFQHQNAIIYAIDGQVKALLDRAIQKAG